MAITLKKVKGTLERVLDKNLQDLVRGIRNHKDNEAKYIAECLDEIKTELRQDSIAVKANAVQKLTYLQMLGYDISWAAFNVIEVMSSTKFTWKRQGYLAASQSFHEGTDVLMLTTNMIRKDLGSQNIYESGIALTGLSCFITPDLSRDLANDIMTLMTSTKPYLRKKAVLILYKVFLKFPEALRPAFPRLKDKLEDPDPGVQSAAVNVICELARKNPRNYLSLAPIFFKLMTSSTNNWVLIKIIKLFGALTPLEPRLGKKLIEPLTNLIHSTSAMSLLYECINTVIAGIPNHSASIQLCVQKLRILIEDSDQNLKYLGLLAMSRILKTHPKSVQTHKDLILQCLDDKDESIRLRALDLLFGMVSKKNLMEIVKKLMIHMDKAEGSYYRDELLAKTIEISSQSNFQYITNFEWYVSVLVELTRMEGTRHGRLIASQMLDVAIRVQAIRPFAVGQMAVLLENAHVMASNVQKNGITEVLYAAAWICGEFCEHLSDPKSTLESMLRPKVTTIPGHIQSAFVQNIMKLYSRILNQAEEEDDGELIKEVGQMLMDKLPMFVQSADLEVQERACCAVQLMKYITKLQDKGVKCAEEVNTLFAGELNPVAAKAQKKVPIPEGLNLDKWINEPLSESSEEDEPVKTNIFVSMDEHRTNYQESERKTYQPTEEEVQQQREQRMMEQASNPFYIKGKTKKKSKYNDLRNVEEIPVAQIDLSVPLHVPGMVSSDKYINIQKESMAKSGKKSKKKKKKRRHGKAESDSDEDIPTIHAVSTAMDMPEGVSLSDQEEDHQVDEYSALDINLDAPLREEERLPVPKHREVPDASSEIRDETTEKTKKKHKHKEKGEKRKEKKIKKKKSKAPEEEQPSLLVSAAEDTPTITPELSPEKKPKENTTPGVNDLDFWLSDKAQDASATVELPSNHHEEIEVMSDEEKPKKKKEKKVKKGGKDKRKKKSEYEEAEGMSTPSKEHSQNSHAVTPADLMSQLPAMSSYKTLGENNSLKMMYEMRASLQHTNQVVASVIFTNQSENHIKDLELNVMDSMNTKLVRGFGASQHDAVKVPFILLPNAQNEGQFAFNVQNINMSQKLKGTLTFIVKNEEGSTHDKIDFRINIPVTSYLLAASCKSSQFTELLSSGELTEKFSTNFNTVDSEFTHVLAKICFFAHFTVVEQVEKNASLYSKSIQGHHVCLLVKQLGNNGLSIDGKSTDTNLLSGTLDDMKTVLTENC